jgi:hypothetical protein
MLQLQKALLLGILALLAAAGGANGIHIRQQTACMRLCLVVISSE